MANIDHLWKQHHSVLINGLDGRLQSRLSHLPTLSLRPTDFHSLHDEHSAIRDGSFKHSPKRI